MVQPGGAKIFFWGARALFVGQALGLAPHRNAVAVLCAGLDGAFEVSRDPGCSGADYSSHRVALIPAGTLHHLKSGAGRMAFLYLDAHSSDYRHLLEGASYEDPRLAWGLACEAACVSALTRLAGGQQWASVRSELAAVLGLSEPQRRDERISETLRLFRDDPAGSHSLGELARKARLSPSRFQHLFKESTGVPVRRYKVWSRMGCAVRAMAAGTPLTNAAHQAGFSSSAHFSTAFSAMFGMPPSRLARMPLGIEEGAVRLP